MAKPPGDAENHLFNNMAFRLSLESLSQLSTIRRGTQVKGRGMESMLTRKQGLLQDSCQTDDHRSLGPSKMSEEGQKGESFTDLGSEWGQSPGQMATVNRSEAGRTATKFPVC